MSHLLGRFIPTAFLLVSSFAAAGEKEIFSPPAEAPELKLPELTAEQLADEEASKHAADDLEKLFDEGKHPEAVRMLVAILRGSLMGPGDGWFGPAESRLGWQRFAELQGVDDLVGTGEQEGAVSPDKFQGPAETFARLDRNADGTIKADDFDWSPKNPWVQQAYSVSRMFRRINQRGDGKMTKEDLEKFFERTVQDKDYLTVGEFRDAMIGLPPGSPPPGRARPSDFARPSDMPSRSVLVQGLYTGEVGSIHEGPHVGDAAPDFTLNTVQEGKAITLSDMIGKKPLVVVFGNFTCGPFRSFYPDVDAVRQKYQDQAEFLMVYVREAHPTDGWHMDANEKVGVSVKQPRSLEERVQVCGQFCERLNPSMPVVVDDVNDGVGHAYSAMPARLYVIDSQGKVAYKSGRGPFGFIVPEMEQALVMSLLEQAAPKEAEKEAE